MLIRRKVGGFAGDISTLARIQIFAGTD